MDTLAQVKTVGETAEPLLFDPNFLNLQFFFNLVLTFLKWIASLGDLIGFEVDEKLLWNIFLFFTVVLLFGIVYSVTKLREVRKREEEHWSGLHVTALENVDTSERNYRWEKILDQIDSFNESDWRVAIMDADSMLGDMLDKMEYIGESIGEQLRGIEQSDFRTLSQAWEAHKVRNKLAHEGEFILTKRETRRVIDLYREVFEEFHYI
ncbi:hypothetical protein CL630_00675 [bacterium]|nr:hypothetical protein [bacterium]|tara:strand:- start:19916 stop:20539 length:624 start_codon:yes stop_codon:yes gene_type:complete